MMITYILNEKERHPNSNTHKQGNQAGIQKLGRYTYLPTYLPGCEV